MMEMLDLELYITVYIIYIIIYNYNYVMLFISRYLMLDVSTLSTKSLSGSKQ